MVTLVSTAAAAAVALTRPVTYVASTKVLLKPIRGNPLSPAAIVNGQLVTVAMQTEAGLVSSSAVLSLVESRLKLTVPPGSVSSNIPVNTQIVQIQFSAPDPQTARTVVGAYAQAFLDYRSAQAKESIRVQLTGLEAQEAEVSKNLQKATTALGKANGSGSTQAVADAQTNVQLYSARLSALQETIGELQADDNDPGSIVTQPSVGQGSRTLMVAGIVTAGLLFGVLASAALIIWWERTDDRLRADEDPFAGGLELVGRLPSRAPVRWSEEGLEDGGGAVASYRALRTAVVAGQKPPAVVVLAAFSTEPTADVALNLALALQRSGRSTAVLDATMTDSGVAELVGHPATPGFADLLVSGEDLPRSLPELMGVRILPRGEDPGGVRDRYLSAHVGELIDEFRRSSDFLVVAAPGIGTSEGQALALLADQVLVVVTDGVSRHRAVQQLAERVTRRGVHLTGAVSVSASPRGPGRPAGHLASGPGPVGPFSSADEPSVDEPSVDEPSVESSVESSVGERL